MLTRPVDVQIEHYALDIDATWLSTISLHDKCLNEMLIAILLINEKQINGELFVNTHRSCLTMKNFYNNQIADKIPDEKKREYYKTYHAVENLKKLLNRNAIVITADDLDEVILHGFEDLKKYEETNFSSSALNLNFDNQLYSRWSKATANKNWQYLMIANYISERTPEGQRAILRVFEDSVNICKEGLALYKQLIWPHNVILQINLVSVRENIIYHNLQITNEKDNTIKGVPIEISDLLSDLPTISLPESEKDLIKHLNEIVNKQICQLLFHEEPLFHEEDEEQKPQEEIVLGEDKTIQSSQKNEEVVQSIQLKFDDKKSALHEKSIFQSVPACLSENKNVQDKKNITFSDKIVTIPVP